MKVANFRSVLVAGVAGVTSNKFLSILVAIL